MKVAFELPPAQAEKLRQEADLSTNKNG